MVDDLTPWLLGQLARDEQAARALPNAIGGLQSRFSPAKLIADYEAKRRIVQRHAPRVAVEGMYRGELICGCSEGTDEFLARPWPCADVRDIASVYSDRTGYQDAWRP